MTAEKITKERKDNIFRWATWALVIGLWLCGLELLNTRLHWIIIYLLLSAAAILFALLVPVRTHQFRAICLAVVLIFALWAGKFINLWFDAIRLPDTAIVQQLNLEAARAWELAMALGAVLAVIFIVTLIILAALIAVEYGSVLEAEKNDNRWKAAIKLLRHAFGFDARLGAIENGKFKSANSKDTAAMPKGPGRVNISSGQAVIFERLGKVSQIAGPGPAHIAPQEQGKHIVPLGPRNISFSGDGLLTKDGIPLALQGTLIVSTESVTSLRNHRGKHGSPESRWYSPYQDLKNKDHIITGNVTVHHKESIYRCAYLPPASNLDQALQDAAMSALRDAIAKRPFIQIIKDSQCTESVSALDDLTREGKNALDLEIACWGIELVQLRLDRLQISEKAQEEAMLRWKQAPENRVSKEEAEAQKNFLQTLRQFEDSGTYGSDANDYFELFITCSRIIRRVRGVSGSEGMKSLNTALRVVISKIHANPQATKKLSDALKDLNL